MKNYNNFFLPIDNMESAKEFYGGILGLQLKLLISSTKIYPRPEKGQSMDHHKAGIDLRLITGMVQCYLQAH